MSAAQKAKGCTCPNRTPAQEDGVLYCESCGECIYDRAPKKGTATLEQSVKLSARPQQELERLARSVEWLEATVESLLADKAALTARVEQLEGKGAEGAKEEWLRTREATAILHCSSKHLRRNRSKYGGKPLDPENPRSHPRWPRSIIEANAPEPAGGDQ